MQQAFLKNIQAEIIKQLQTAQKSIFIAMAWFTDTEIFAVLVAKAQQGVKIEIIIINDEINTANNPIDWTSLEKAGGKVYLLGQSEDGNMMHHKFCVIDEEKLIQGSYNWTRKAKNNHESINLTTNSPEVIKTYLTEFKTLRDSYFFQNEPIEANHRTLDDILTSSEKYSFLKSLHLIIASQLNIEGLTVDVLLFPKKYKGVYLNGENIIRWALSEICEQLEIMWKYPKMHEAANKIDAITDLDSSTILEDYNLFLQQNFGINFKEGKPIENIDDKATLIKIAKLLISSIDKDVLNELGLPEPYGWYEIYPKLSRSLAGKELPEMINWLKTNLPELAERLTKDIELGKISSDYERLRLAFYQYFKNALGHKDYSNNE